MTPRVIIVYYYDSDTSTCSENQNRFEIVLKVFGFLGFWVSRNSETTKNWRKPGNKFVILLMFLPPPLLPTPLEIPTRATCNQISHRRLL
jgi:hypothetical protein